MTSLCISFTPRLRDLVSGLWRAVPPAFLVAVRTCVHCIDPIKLMSCGDGDGAGAWCASPALNRATQRLPGVANEDEDCRNFPSSCRAALLQSILKV